VLISVSISFKIRKSKFDLGAYMLLLPKNNNLMLKNPNKYSLCISQHSIFPRQVSCKSAFYVSH
jgi:hypothetical protein